MHTSASTSTWPIWTLISTVFGSILEVGLLCVAGYVLARHGILDKKTQKHLNRLNVSLFTPSLLFSKVAFSLTPEKLKELWVIPIVFVVTTACSMFVAYAFGSILRLKKSQRSFAMAASMFMNSNSLPIALIQSMVYSVEALRWGDGDDADAMLGRALTYLVLYSTFGMMLRWSYGVRLLSQADEGEHSPPRQDEPHQHVETSPLLNSASTHPRYMSQSAPALILTSTYDSSASSDGSASPTSFYNPHGLNVGDHILLPAPAIPPKYFTSFPNTPVYPRSEVSSDSDITEDEENQALPSGNTLSTRTFRRRIWSRICAFTHELNDFMTVPMWAALASLIVACVHPLQHALEQHMRPVKFALNSAGNCSIPLTLVVLGAYFYVPKVDAEAENLTAPQRLKTHLSDLSLVDTLRKVLVLKRGHVKRLGNVFADEGNVQRPGETRTVVAAVLSRMVLTPLILLPLLALLMSSDSRGVFDDPVFALVNVLLITSAPALTLAQMTQAASGDAFERLISRTIFWAYCVVTPVSTIISVVIGLLIARL